MNQATNAPRLSRRTGLALVALMAALALGGGPHARQARAADDDATELAKNLLPTF